MSKDVVVIDGTANFSHLTEHEQYKGKSTERYALTITLDEETADKLAANGVKVKEYQGKKQRKFTSIYDVRVMDNSQKPFEGEVPYGSTVKVGFKYGAKGEHGVPTYLNVVQVVEAANAELPDGFNNEPVLEPTPQQSELEEEDDIPF